MMMVEWHTGCTVLLYCTCTVGANVHDDGRVAHWMYMYCTTVLCTVGANVHDDGRVAHWMYMYCTVYCVL